MKHADECCSATLRKLSMRIETLPLRLDVKTCKYQKAMKLQFVPLFFIVAISAAPTKTEISPAVSRLQQMCRSVVRKNDPFTNQFVETIRSKRTSELPKPLVDVFNIAYEIARLEKKFNINSLDSPNGPPYFGESKEFMLNVFSSLAIS